VTKHTPSAGRYARALFDVSLKEADPQAVEQHLARLVDVLEQYPLLRRLLTNPVVPTERKQAAVNEIATRLAVAPVLRKLLGMLAGRDMLGMLPELLDRYRQRLLEHLGILRAEVITAVPLTADRVEAIRRGLAAATGKDVTMVARVDPAIIGGVVARVDSTVYDGSIARQLQRLRARMVEGAHS
jgi:F-type H+-transporting ATPase subunit delta